MNSASKPVVVQIGPIHVPSQATLEATYDVRKYWEASDKVALLKKADQDGCKALVTTGFHGVKADVMQHLPQLKMISNFGVGYDAVDVAYCKAHGIGLANTPDVLTEDVADLALALLLASLRKIPQGDRFTRDGKWANGGNLGLTLSMQKAKILILGAGRIGQAIAKRCQSFNAVVAYSGPRKKPELSMQFFADLIEGARWADVVIAALPGGTATQGAMSRAALEALGPKGTFVNIARGSVVDEPALIELLQSGKLGAAALDVFYNEPTINTAFFSMDNVVIHPHQGSATHSTRDAMGNLVLDNLAAYVAGKPLLTPVLTPA